MKKIIFNAGFLIAGLFIVSSLFAQDDDHKNDHKKEEPKFKKTKSYSKSYNLSSSDKVKLKNQFGEMKLTTWDKNEIKVDVTIIGKSDDEPRAQEILDRISIKDSKEGNTVSFETKFADDDKKEKNDKKEHRNEGMEINYAVYLPATAALDASNQFGKMIIPDYRGEAEIESKFGTLTAGKISNAKEVDVEFGKANIEHINGGKLTIKFSEGTVNKLSGDIKTNLEFSQVKLNIDNDIKSLDLRNSYSTVYLDLNKNLSASFDISTSFGEFSNKSSFAIKEEGKDDNDRHGPTFNRKYSGTAGGGAAKLKINSSFGEIVAGHDLKVDLSEKHKEKSHTRSI